MNPFHRHGIEHVSSSALTCFLSDPYTYVERYVFKRRSPSNASMERGTAVEAGIVARLKGAAADEGLKEALGTFDFATQGVNGDVEGERTRLGGFIEQGYRAVKDYGTPEWPAKGKQHKVELDVEFSEGLSIPLIGYMDLVYPDCVIDLKSTKAVPSSMSLSHRLQGSIYARQTNKPVKFVYFSDKKSAALEDPDIAASQACVRATVTRLANFLSLTADRDVLLAACPVVLESWGWSGRETARKQLFGV